MAAIAPAPLFKGLSPAELAETASRAHEVRLARKQAVCRQGEPVKYVSLLCAGRAKAAQLTANGDIVIVRLAGPGEVLSGLGFTPGACHPATQEALEPCDVLSWDLRVFEAFCDRIPTLRRNALRIVGERLRELEERYRELATEKVAPRLARALLRLLGQIGRQAGDAVVVRLSREELAQLTGTTVFTVSRLLSTWEAAGFLRGGREAVVVADPSGLASVAADAKPGGEATAWVTLEARRRRG